MRFAGLRLFGEVRMMMAVTAVAAIVAGLLAIEAAGASYRGNCHERRDGE
jgi:hypothetical protein